MPRPHFSPHLLLRAGQHAALFIAVAFPCTALAQSTISDPLSADQTSPLSYRSAFEGYRWFRADEIPSWRSINDTVRTTGGHTGSVRAGASPPPEAPAPKPVPSMPVQIEPPPHGHGQ
jgi:hypothetical protein